MVCTFTVIPSQIQNGKQYPRERLLFHSTLYYCFFLPFAAPIPELDAAAAAAERSTGGKERVKVGGAGPLPLVEAAAPLVVLAVKRLTLRPRDGRRRLQQNVPNLIRILCQINTGLIGSPRRF